MDIWIVLDEKRLALKYSGVKDERKPYSRVYRGGDYIYGWVVVPEEAHEDVKDVGIRFEGRRIVESMISEERNNEYVFIEAELDQLKQSKKQRRSGKVEFYDREGLHFYPFRIALPHPETALIPSTATILRLTIRYTLKARLRRNDDYDIFFTQPITIRGTWSLDHLQATPEYLMETQKSRLSGCCICPSSIGHFGFHLKMKKCHYLPGEYIDFKLAVFHSTSSSHQHVHLVQLQLGRFLHVTLQRGKQDKVDMTSQQRQSKKYITEEEILCFANGPKVPKGGGRVWSGKVLSIPKYLPPSHLGCPQLLQLEYFVQVKMRLAGMCHRSLTGRIPIQVGTAPCKLLPSTKMIKREVVI